MEYLNLQTSNEEKEEYRFEIIQEKDEYLRVIFPHATDFSSVAKILEELAKNKNKIIKLTHDSINIDINPEMTADDISNIYNAEFKKIRKHIF